VPDSSVSDFGYSFDTDPYLGYLGYLVDDLHWSRWVLSGDVVAQCCLRPLLLVSLESLLSGCNHIISVPSVGIFKSRHGH
jgi:hypothetical protein